MRLGLSCRTSEDLVSARARARVSEPSLGQPRPAERPGEREGRRRLEQQIWVGFSARLGTAGTVAGKGPCRPERLGLAMDTTKKPESIQIRSTTTNPVARALAAFAMLPKCRYKAFGMLMASFVSWC